MAETMQDAMRLTLKARECCNETCLRGVFGCFQPF